MENSFCEKKKQYPETYKQQNNNLASQQLKEKDGAINNWLLTRDPTPFWRYPNPVLKRSHNLTRSSHPF